MDNSNNDREQLKVFLEDAHLQQYYEAFRDILKVTKVSQLQYVFTKDLAQIGMSKPERRRLKKIYATYFPNACIYRLKKLLCSKKTKHCRSLGRRSIPMEILPSTENVMNGSIKHIIPIEDITINKELGTGQFGVVQLGTWTTGNQRLQVAIKCLGQERMTSDSNEFLKEAAVMHSIEHRNIVRLYGVVLHMDSLMLVTELAPLRSLLECLREVSLRTSFPVPTLCDFAEQICDGMAYLERKRLIHRDLAARNILVFNKYEVKISDFGLSRALGAGKDYYQTNYNVNLKLPVAWCAPECILYLRFTSSSDVWAFGVCLWEMFTYGFQPWAAFSGQQILEAIDSPNYQRLERPECCPEDYYTMMLECWSHEPNKRPKFKDLVSRLRDIKPETVQAISTFVRPEGGRRPGMLEYKSGQIITVLGRQRETRGHDMGHMYENKNTPETRAQHMTHTYENKKTNMAHCTLWYGVLPGGTCGMFDPAETKPYIEVEKGSHFASISPHPMRQSSRTIRSSLLRSDVKRHTYTGKRTIQRSMISSPQGDVKHTGHVGLDGAYFGDIPFLETAGPPLQIVSPYKPSEDVEQQPLINPNSPSHLSGASGSHYSLHGAGRDSKNRDEVNLSYGNTKSKNQKKVSHKSTSEPTASKKFFNRVKNATLGRSHRSEDNAASKTDEVHEYHEISDTDTEGNATDLPRLDSCGTPESPGLPKGDGDFSQSLIDEMESMFRSLESSRRDEASGTGRSADGETLRSHTLIKADKKKQAFHTGTLKPMSAGEEKTLATAVALANELTSKSMNDLDGERKPPNSPSDRSKFQLKFPQFSLYNATHEPEKDAAGKHERRNFSEEANSVPDIQSIITEESKHAYTSLIEQPMTSSTVITHLGPHSILTMPKPAPRSTSRSQFKSLQLPRTSRPAAREPDQQVPSCAINELPLPPRNTKPKLVDKPRHVRKYPLKLPNAPAPDRLSHTIIYQNASLPPAWPVTPKVRAVSPVQPSTSVYANEVDVCDGKEKKMDTNPFKSGSCSGNPFDCSDDDDDIDCGLDLYYADGSDDDEEPDEGLVKDCSDHVSVEDLLEFANQKPCGRQRGVESDEVRIMRKVLKKYKVSAEQCVNALELTDWDAHKAIKVVRVQIATETNVSLQHCIAELEQTSGDIQKAAAALQLKMNL